MSDLVNVPSATTTKMARRYELIDSLRGGTLAMRDAGSKWLPKEDAETDTEFSKRIARSVLYEAYPDTVSKLASKPFTKPVVIEGADDLPPQMVKFADNVDKLGNSISQFAHDLFEMAIDYGLAHVLVDYPAVSENLTLADESAGDIRPYCVIIKPQDMLGWQTRVDASGAVVLTQIRFRESVVEIDADGFTEKLIERVRIVTELDNQIYQKDSKGNWVGGAVTPHTFGAVPLITYYTKREAFMQAKPPLESLAWLNLLHWQSSSDQRNILRFSRMGHIFGSGFTNAEIKKGITLGANKLTLVNNADAKLGVVEHQGHSISAGVTDLATLESQMEVLGLQPLIAAAANTTATAQNIGEAKTHSNIQAWIQNLDAVLERIFRYSAQWVTDTSHAEALPDLEVKVFNDFSATLSSTTDVKHLIEMRDKTQITHKTFLQEVKRRGLLEDTVNVDDELKQAIKESNGMLNAIENSGDGDDE